MEPPDRLAAGWRDAPVLRAISRRRPDPRSHQNSPSEHQCTASMMAALRRLLAIPPVSQPLSCTT